MDNREKRNQVFHHLRDLLLVTIIGVFITFLFYLFSGANGSFLSRIPGIALYSLTIGGFLWKGNQFLGHFIHKKINIDRNPKKALWWSLISMFIYTIIAIVFVNYFWEVLMSDRLFANLFSGWMLITMAIQFVITIIIASILFSISFFNAWRRTAVNEEKLKTESIALQYKALKNQVNPHFLFNSLNTLSTLVYRDPDIAAKFIKQLSEVYRYVLEHKDNELIGIKTELEFVEKYLYLQKIRHGDNLISNIRLKNCADCKIVPLSIQMLVENAIKHNIVSKDDPLTINLFQEDDYIVVQNDLQPRSTVEDSEGIGLNNIRDRYNHLSDKEFIVSKGEGLFTVKIPIIYV